MMMTQTLLIALYLLKLLNKQWNYTSCLNVFIFYIYDFIVNLLNEKFT